MEYFYPFGETVRRLVQQDRTPKHVLSLVYMPVLCMQDGKKEMK